MLFRSLQYRSDPSRPITSQIEPSFVAVVKQNGEIDGDVPAEYRDIQKVAKSFGFFYDSGVLGALKLPDSLAGPARQIDQQEKK